MSGIVANHVPFFLQPNRLPSFKTNSIEDWDKKLEGIINETIDCDLRLIGGIPPWVIMYFQKILKKPTKKMQILFSQTYLFMFTVGLISNHIEHAKSMMQMLIF